MSPRTEYESQLQQVHDELLLIGSMVEKAIKRSIESLRTRDVELARRIVDEDDEIDDRYLALEELCIDIIARQQPMASDLRALITGMQVGSELERMGDYAEGIAKISIRMGDEPPLKPLIDIPRMADISIGMLRDSLTALNERDDALARRVAQGAGDLPSAAIGVVDHQAPVHHQDDPQRRATHLAVRLQRQVEHRHIQRRRLAGAGRQVQHVRPAVLARELLDEPLLPRKWGIAVNGTKEGRKVGRGQRHHPAVPPSRRQSPSPV